MGGLAGKAGAKFIGTFERDLRGGKKRDELAGFCRHLDDAP
jgi:hypothetical protein